MRAGVVLASLVLLVAAPTAGAATSRHCSPSGDVCYGAFRSGHATQLRITLAAKYFSRYTLCVRPPSGARTCHRFGIFAAGHGLYGSTVTWARHFPDRGPGTYHATYDYGSGPVAPSIAFATGPSIRVAPAAVRRGGAVRVSGTAGGCPAGEDVVLLSRAFSSAHRFAGVNEVTAKVRGDDTYSVRTRIPTVRRPGRYFVTGRCGGGNFGVTAVLRVVR